MSLSLAGEPFVSGLFPVFLKLEGSRRAARGRRHGRALEAAGAPRHRSAAAGGGARGPSRDRGERCRGRAPRLRGRRPRRRLAGDRRGHAGGEPRGRARRRGSARLRQRGGRPAAGVGLPRRRRAQGRRGGGGVHGRPGARRSPGSCARRSRPRCPTTSRAGSTRRPSFARDRRRRAFRSSGAARRCSRS